jgi:hypothetical protein
VSEQTQTTYRHTEILCELAARLQAAAALAPVDAMVALGELLDRERPDSADRSVFAARQAAARAAKHEAGSGVALARALGVSEELVSRLTREVPRSPRR